MSSWGNSSDEPISYPETPLKGSKRDLIEMEMPEKYICELVLFSSH